MKINYTFANGETSDVEVNEEIGNLILDSRREESNQDRKERYHCYSLDAAEYEGEDYADGSTPEMELFRQLENQRIKKAFEQLSEVQRRRLLMLAEGVTSGMRRRKCRYKNGSPIFRCRMPSGRNTISTRRSMTVVLAWIWNWFSRPLR